MDTSLLMTHLSFVRDILKGRAAGEYSPPVSIFRSILNRQETIYIYMIYRYSDGNLWEILAGFPLVKRRYDNSG